MKTFALITHARAGTQMFWSGMGCCSKISCFRYWFDLNQPIAQESRETRKDYAQNFHHQDWLRFLQSTPEGITHLGTWTHYVTNEWIDANTPIASEDFWQLLCDKHDQTILLHRENLLYQYLSEENAKLTQNYSTAIPREKALPKIRINLESGFHGFVQRKVAAHKMLKDTFGDKLLILCYERLTADPAEAFYQVQEFLGVTPKTEVVISTYKQENRLVQDIVQNYQELQLFLDLHNWSSWLN